ncbi:MAG: ABC transporter ATP-binding protein, partial [Candidatus Dormibacteraeota bacterium]|nr:ABC transporter ATP-binding protein [Candidatus Dormibacteraeota bacterium]
MSLAFGGVLALDGVSFEVEQGRVVGLIGPNGAGKTTLFNVITRLYQPDRGDVLFAGESLINQAPHRIVKVGISRTFQNLELMKSMTVLDNVLVGLHRQLRLNFVANGLGWPSSRRREREAVRIARDTIAYLGLDDVAQAPVGGLPFGLLKRVELARALAARPQLLLLDEPAGGLNHDQVEELRGLLLAIRDDFNATVLIVEHHMGLVMAIS